MSDNASNNKRIAKNTAFLYLRMFISMSVSLYTSRVILKTLGVEDYGVYNVVGGVVAMFSFINATMSSATSRFLTFEIGRNNQEKLKDTFNASFWVHVVIAAIVFILCETIGLWFLNYKMVIPEGREFAANIVFQLSILATIISITQVPYNATLIAHEKMDIYAYVEMANVFLRLAILYLLVIFKYDKLILYGILTLIVSTGIAMFYRMYGASKYKECHVQLKWQWPIIKPMLSFSGWDFFGNMSVTARTQGVSMLLNVFFGPVMNAAAAIASSVQGAVMSFANNVSTAVRPQIIKYYAQGKSKEMGDLINNACRLNFFILSLLTIPLCGEINYILSIWLGEYPSQTAIFCILTLLFNLFANMSYMVATGIHAYGRIIRPSLINGTLYLLVIPITYFSFKLGGNAWAPYLFNLLAVICGMLSNVYTLHKYIPDYSIKTFIYKVLLRAATLLCFGFIIVHLINTNLPTGFFRLVITIITSTTSMGLLGWYIMLNKGQRIKIIKMIKGFINKVYHRRFLQKTI